MEPSLDSGSLDMGSLGNQLDAIGYMEVISLDPLSHMGSNDECGGVCAPKLSSDSNSRCHLISCYELKKKARNLKDII